MKQNTKKIVEINFKSDITMLIEAFGTAKQMCHKSLLFGRISEAEKYRTAMILLSDMFIQNMN